MVSVKALILMAILVIAIATATLMNILVMIVTEDTGEELCPETFPMDFSQ